MGSTLRILGTAQDAGIPHAACACPHCAAARRDPARRRRIASLALVLPMEDAPPHVFLVDATPDVREQLEALEDVRSGRVARNPIDGIFLTHAHIGHYLGLAFFGFESVSSRRISTWCTPRLAQFLRTNGPWDLLVERENIVLDEIALDVAIDLGAGVRITPHLVPHRDEYSDTVGYLIQGPATSVFYVPDTEPWPTWTPSLPEYLDAIEGGVDVLLVDATFYAVSELPGRAVSGIGHPLVTDTMDLLQSRVDAGLRVCFTHLNHSNPAVDPESAERAEIERRGFEVAAEGMEIEIG